MVTRRHADFVARLQRLLLSGLVGGLWGAGLGVGSGESTHMSHDDQMEAKLLELPTKDRARLARMLLVSLEPQEDEEVDRLWVEESEKRLKEWREGKVTAISASEVFEEARKALK